MGTQLAASAVTAISADPTQRRIMFALPFVFVIFIINFPAGLIVYWITTNVWTIGQQLLVKKLYPKPEPLDPRDAVPEREARAREARHGGRAHRRRLGREGEAGREGQGEGEGAGLRRRERRAGQGAAAALRARRRSARGAGAEALTTMSVSEEPRPEELVAEAEGDSLGEAKWAAMKDARGPLSRAHRRLRAASTWPRTPAPDEPARVRAEVDVEAWRAAAEEIPEEPAERVRAIVGRVVHALGLHATVDIDESDDEIRATVNGDDLGLLIGKHGSTIDALQHLAFRAAFRGAEDRKQVIVDAAGYRERREAALHRMADRAAAEALRYDRPGRARADARDRAQDRAHVPERAQRRGDAQRGRRARPPAGRESRLSVSRETLEALVARHRLGTAAAGQLARLLEALAAEPDPHTTRRDPEAALEVHVADSLSGLEVPELRSRAAGSRTSAQVQAFPGWCWRCAIPRAQVDLIESAGRKTAVIDRLIQAARAGQRALHNRARGGLRAACRRRWAAGARPTTR